MSAARSHVSLNVSDLGRAVAFYRTLLGVEPAKHHRDYAKFEVDDPPLVLSLEPVFHRSTDAFNHLGLRLPDEGAVRQAQARLQAAGMVAEREDDVECCYSRQTKFWLLDPDRNLWEIYALTGELDRRGSLTASDAVAARDRAGVLRSFEHRLGDPVPAPIELPDGAVDEVRLRGTFNAPMTDEARRALLQEARRVLAPGGRILIHGLASDGPIPGGFPRLPGPAALARETPLEREPPAWLAEAGFLSVYVQKLGELPNFEHGGVKMRELLCLGWAPPATVAEDAAAVVVVYKGPFTVVEDEAGRRYRAGERVTVDAQTAARLRLGPLSDQLVFLRDRAPR